MRWVPYYDDCLRLLAESEHPSDTLLAHTVRIQLIVERALQAPWHDPATAECSRAPSSFYIKSLERDLLETRQQVPADLLQNQTLLLHYYGAELTIHEVALTKAEISSNGLGSAAQRLDWLWACLQATKNWFNLFLQYDASVYPCLPISLLSKMAHALVALSRLSTFEHPGWDLKIVRETCNLSTILDEIALRFTQVRTMARIDLGISGDNDTWSNTSRRIFAIKSWWNAKLAAEEQASTGLDNPVADPAFTGGPIDFSDDAWLRDMLGLDDSQFEQFLQTS